MLAALVLALLLVPAPAASTPAIATTIVPPYHGVVAVNNSSVLSGCGSVAYGTQPHFSLRHGGGGFQVQAAGRTCAPRLDHASAAPSIVVRIPLRFSTTGAHRVYANGSAAAHLAEIITPGTCALLSSSYSYCDVVANESVSVYADVLDLTNGSVAWSLTGIGEYNFTGNFSVLTQGTHYLYTAHNQGGSLGPFSLVIAGSFVASHRYVLEFLISGSAAAGTEAFHARLTHASAVARINVAAGGNNVTLSSVVVT